MSHHVNLRCACGQASVDGSAWFTAIVWDDILGCLEALGIANPHLAIPADGLQVDAGDFLAWWEEALGRMRDARDHLPILYRVWHHNQTDAGYCVCRGRGWKVEGTYDDLTAVALRAEVWQQRRAGLAYDPPVVEDAAPELVDVFGASADGGRVAVALTADVFTRIFRGTALTLEHGRLSDFFAAELAAVEALARHGAGRGETIGIYGW